MLPQQISLTPEEINTLAKAGIIPANTPAAQVQLFAETCKQYNLSPFRKEIYLVQYGSKYAVIVGIDGFRSKAGRTGLHAGTDDAKYNMQPDGSFLTAAQIKAQGVMPVTCTITVYKIIGGQRYPFVHTAVFSEFYPSGGGKAASMPFQMISKCAEAFALKKAFPSELAGLHIEEEIPAFQGETIDATPVEVSEPEPLNVERLQDEIYKCESADALKDLFGQDARYKRPEIMAMFSKRKAELRQLFENGQIPA